MSASTSNRFFRVTASSVLATSLLWTAFGLAQPARAHAQTPSEGVVGPWLNIFQLVWFTNPDYGNSGTDQDYTSNYGRKYEYGKERRAKCYYHDGTEPEADEVNSLFLMMSCRVGLVVGVVTWSAVGVALMAFAWGGLMHVVDSTAGGDRAGALRNMITSPLVGLLIAFLAYVLATLIYVTMRYNFERYLNPDVWG